MPSPDPWLVSAAPLFSGLGGHPVLDLACGLGQNAIWISRLGLQVLGIDASPAAVARARAEADRLASGATFERHTVMPGSPLSGSRPGPWGAILVFHFLDRSLFRQLEDALAPHGLLVYKTHLAHPSRAAGAPPRRPSFLLGSGELLGAFPRLEVLTYREWARGGRAFAALLARKAATLPKVSSAATFSPPRRRSLPRGHLP